MTEQLDTIDRADQTKLVGGVFISHVHEDRAIADAFSTLVGDVTAGTVPTYASSSTSPLEGIQYGDEWFQWIRSKVESADHVVAILTPRSVGKPWILFEAGLGKASTNSTMFGLAVGMSVADASVGPFGVFQNSSAEKLSLIKLCDQLTASTPVEPRPAVVERMVDIFLETVSGIVPEEEPVVEDTKSAALFQAIEDLKFLVREQRTTGNDVHSPVSRHDRALWSAMPGLLDELPSAARRQMLVRATHELIGPAIGTLAEASLLSGTRNLRSLERILSVLDQGLGETRMTSSNDWVFHFVRREMDTIFRDAHDRGERTAESRRRRSVPREERQAEQELDDDSMDPDLEPIS